MVVGLGIIFAAMLKNKEPRCSTDFFYTYFHRLQSKGDGEQLNQALQNNACNQQMMN